MPAPTVSLTPLIERGKSDPGGTYRSWFLWDDRLKIFRSIRRTRRDATDRGWLHEGVFRD